jgi:nitrogen regulatory protein P-II 1
MKLIEAIIKPVKLEEVESALQKIGIEEFMESALICHGRQKGQAMLYRGVEHMANFVEKVNWKLLPPTTRLRKSSRSSAISPGRIGWRIAGSLSSRSLKHAEYRV